MSPSFPVIVVAAVLVEDGRVLVSKRRKGSHLAGCWEFPGGKVDPGEDPRDALVREMKEELDVDVSVGAPVEITFHKYPEKSVLLMFFEATRVSAVEPTPREVADVRWARKEELIDAEFPPADIAVLAKVRASLG